jgi:hypothetical protein
MCFYLGGYILRDDIIQLWVGFVNFFYPMIDKRNEIRGIPYSSITPGPYWVCCNLVPMPRVVCSMVIIFISKVPGRKIQINSANKNHPGVS